MNTSSLVQARDYYREAIMYVSGPATLISRLWHFAKLNSCISGTVLADMQVSLSEMQKDCSRCKIFASRAATPECRPAEFHRFGPRTLSSTRQSAIFSENARTLHARTRFPTRIFASRAANPARRTAVFTGRLAILLFYYLSNSTVTALANKNTRTLHARARFSTRM